MKQGSNFSLKSNKRRCITVYSHFKSSGGNNSNTPNSDNVIRNSNLPCINVHTKSPLNKLITFQIEIKTQLSISINDEITDEKNTSEEISCQHDNIMDENN